MKKQERFYDHHGKRLVSVTTALGVLNKPALVPWAVREERRKFREAMLEALTRRDIKGTAEGIWEQVEVLVEGISEADRLAKKAADIGTQAHSLIMNHMLEQMGRKPVPLAKDTPAASLIVFDHFKSWAESVDLEPQEVELEVHNAEQGYAGRIDLIARVCGLSTVIDFKSSKAIYPEAYLQVRAYQHAALAEGFPVDDTLVLRLPKEEGDLNIEAKAAPDYVTLDDFLACVRLWKLLNTIKENKQ